MGSSRTDRRFETEADGASEDGGDPWEDGVSTGLRTVVCDLRMDLQLNDVGSRSFLSVPPYARVL